MRDRLAAVSHLMRDLRSLADRWRRGAAYAFELAIDRLDDPRTTALQCASIGTVLDERAAHLLGEASSIIEHRPGLRSPEQLELAMRAWLSSSQPLDDVVQLPEASAIVIPAHIPEGAGMIHLIPEPSGISRRVPETSAITPSIPEPSGIIIAEPSGMGMIAQEGEVLVQRPAERPAGWVNAPSVTVNEVPGAVNEVPGAVNEVPGAVNEVPGAAAEGFL